MFCLALVDFGLSALNLVSPPHPLLRDSFEPLFGWSARALSLPLSLPPFLFC